MVFSEINDLIKPAASRPINNQNAVSRYFERQSDQLALEINEGYDNQIKLLKGLAEANLSNVNPHPVIKTLLYSHPPILERIQTVENKK